MNFSNFSAITVGENTVPVLNTPEPFEGFRGLPATIKLKSKGAEVEVPAGPQGLWDYIRSNPEILAKYAGMATAPGTNGTADLIWAAVNQLITTSATNYEKVQADFQGVVNSEDFVSTFTVPSWESAPVDVLDAILAGKFLDEPAFTWLSQFEATTAETHAEVEAETEAPVVAESPAQEVTDEPPVVGEASGQEAEIPQTPVAAVEETIEEIATQEVTTHIHTALPASAADSVAEVLQANARTFEAIGALAQAAAAQNSAVAKLISPTQVAIEA